MGFEDEMEQSFGRPCRQCDGRFKRTNELTSSIVPRGTSCHRWVELDFLLLHLILHRSQAAATSLVHRNSVPSTHMRCMITANRRASATMAFFIPRCLAIFIAQALRQDHFVERTSMLWADSQSIIRIISSPHRDIAPVRSLSPDLYLAGVSPNTAPTALEFRNRAGTSTVAQ